MKVVLLLNCFEFVPFVFVPTVNFWSRLLCLSMVSIKVLSSKETPLVLTSPRPLLILLGNEKYKAALALMMLIPFSNTGSWVILFK